MEGRGSCRAKYSANREIGKSAGREKDLAHHEVHPPKQVCPLIAE